jgi:hypothetical protein
MRSRAIVTLSFAGLLTAGCSSFTNMTSPYASIDTMSPGWEQRFKLDWKVASESGEARKVTGHLYNDYGQTVRVRLLIRAFDASGAVIYRRVELTTSSVSPFERDYFEFDKLPAADRYVVTVYSYEKAARS